MQDFVDFVMRLWADLLARPDGPFGFRLVVQPMVALLLAVRDGVHDAKTGRSPYFWTVLHDPPERARRDAPTLALIRGPVREAIGRTYPKFAAQWAGASPVD